MINIIYFVALRLDIFEGYAADHGFTKIIAFISTQLSEELAARLFDLIPGLIFARLSEDVVSALAITNKNALTKLRFKSGN